MSEKVYKIDFITVTLFITAFIVLFTLGLVLVAKGNDFIVFIGLVITAILFYIIFTLMNNFHFSQKMLIIGEDGFTDNSLFSGVGYIPWEIVEEIAIFEPNGIFTKPMISVKIYKENLEKMGLEENKYLKLKKVKGYGEINISLNLIFEKTSDVFENMQKYFEEFKTNN